MTPFGMYILEQEGELTTRTSRFRKSIKEIQKIKKSNFGRMDESTVDSILSANQIDPERLTKAEYVEVMSYVNS